MAFSYPKMGLRIQNARATRGMSISDLAERTHFTVKSIALVEAGQAEINMPLLTSLCTALNVTPNDLLEGEYQCTNTRSLQEETMLREMREILVELKGEPEEGFVLRDAETVIREIRDMLREEKSNSSDRRAPVKPASTVGRSKGERTHYF